MPGGGLERAQSIQGRQSSGHPDILQRMTLYHPKRYKVSFVGIDNKANITGNKLASGDLDVQLLTPNDDKSS
jgi:hypothetical protein